MDNITLDKVIGLPPGDLSSLDAPMKYSMPVATIIPGEPKIEKSAAVFRIQTSMTKYKKLLNEYGYSISGDSLKVAFIADNFPTDTFSNEYGASFLENMLNIGPGGIGQLAQMTGSTSGTEMMSELSRSIGSLLDPGLLKTGVGKLEEGANKLQGAFDKMSKHGGLVGKLGNAVNATLGGARLDFPQVWKGSGFSPSYTMTIRLYNPEPSDEKSTKKYIVGPLAALLLLGLPRANKNSTYAYNWPFFNRLNCPGIYFLNPCCITSINVIKGGDQQSIAWNQRMGIVDVRLEFTSLFNTLICGAEKTITDRPTLHSYLNAMVQEKEIKGLPRKKFDDFGVSSRTTNKKDKHSIKSMTGHIADEIEIISTRTDIQQDLVMGELTKTTNQATSLKSFANAIVKQAKNAAVNPITTMQSAVNLVSDYKNKYDSVLNLVGNVKDFDKTNLQSSLSQLSYSLNQFNTEVVDDIKKIKVKDIHAKAQNLKNKTNKIIPETINV